MRKIILAVIAIALTACGGGGGSKSGGTENKGLFSLWEDDEGEVIDLTGGQLSRPMDFAFYFDGGEQCDCRLTLIGTETDGTFVVNNCLYNAYSGAGDPGCNALNQTGDYLLSNNVLTLTGSTGESYQYY